MIQLFKKLVQSYNYIFYDLQDPRTRDWFPNLIVLMAIMIFYNYFCINLGPRIMKHRRPYELKSVMLIYNLFQIFISFYIFYTALTYFQVSYFYCQPVDYSDNPDLIGIHNAAWIYLMVKLIDLLDTVFFVFRKNYRQITGLHLFHHTLMPIVVCVGLRYYPNGHCAFIGLINSFVHTIMYTYYLIAGLGPEFQKYLWWKRYVTVLQLVQFFILFWQSLIPILIGCNYPKWIAGGQCFNSAVFVYLFGKFYYRNYIKKSNTKNISETQKEN